MTLLVTSFLAGILTMAAPCVLPLLPVIIGGSVSQQDKKFPYIIIFSLSVSLLIFTLVLKVSTLFIDVPAIVWATISGGIVLTFGVFTLFPGLWARISVILGIEGSSLSLLQESTKKEGYLKPIMIGAALGPVFTSCSPTYVLIIATILPQSFFYGLLNIIIYVIGLALMLLLVSIYGQQFIANLKWLSDPHSRFKKALGILFILVGIFVITGWDKDLQTYLIAKGIYTVPQVELNLLESM